MAAKNSVAAVPGAYARDADRSSTVSALDCLAEYLATVR
jgi:hypothetical protein